MPESILRGMTLFVGKIIGSLNHVLFKDLKYSRPWAYIQAAAIIAVSYLFRVPISSAVIVVLIGVVAVFMTIRAEEGWGRWERVTWFGLVTTLSVLAIFCIRAEEDKQNGDHQAVMGQFKTSLQTTTEKFSEVTGRFSEVIGKVEHTEELSAKNLASLSGEGSYPCITPQPETIRNRIPLVFWNKGKSNNLTGVQLRVLSMSDFLNQGIYTKPAIDLGTVPPSWPKELPEFLSPVPNSADGVAIYMIDIWTQNGYYTEVLNFRRDKYSPNRGWANRYWLTKFRWLPKHLNTNEMVKGCQFTEWTDDVMHERETK